MYFPPKNYFKNITASPDFYPNDLKSFSVKMSNTAHRAVSKSVQSDFNATRYRKSTQMSKHLAHLLNGSFLYRLLNLQDDKQALRAAVSMAEDQLVRHHVLGLLRDPVCAQGWERKRVQAERQAALFLLFPTAGLMFHWVIFLTPALPFKHCNYFIYFYLVIILLTTGTCNFSVFFLTAHLLILNSANNGAMY